MDEKYFSFLWKDVFLDDESLHEKTAVQMQDDPLSEFSASIHLRADGKLKITKEDFSLLKMPNCM